MLRKTAPFLFIGDMKSLGFNKGWRDLWFKPKTHDEKVKEYVPDVLEESLEEQRAVLAERTSRDVVVELGRKVLREIENKSPTPSIAPSFNTITKEFGGSDLIGQRALSYLLYPTSFKDHGRAASTPHELVENFADNLKDFIEFVEANGSEALDRRMQLLLSSSGSASSAPSAASTEVQAEGDKADASAAVAKNGSEGQAAADAREEGGSSPATEGQQEPEPSPADEPQDVTLYIKLVAGMSLANIRCNDLKNALKCCDNGIEHAIEPQRLGGLLGMKAGILNRMKRFDEAAAVAQKAIEVSNNPQGYLQGAAALKLLKRQSDVVALLEKGKEHLGENEQILCELEAAKKAYKPALAE